MAKKIKIQIKSPEDNMNIKLPCPFWLIKFLSYSGVNIVSIAKRYSSNKYLDKITKEHMDLLKIFTIESLKELKDCDSFDLVDIASEDGEIVKISVM